MQDKGKWFLYLVEATLNPNKYPVYKLGITTNNIKQRFAPDKKYYNYINYIPKVYKFIGEIYEWQAEKLERLVQRNIIQYFPNNNNKQYPHTFHNFYNRIQTPGITEIRSHNEDEIKYIINFTNTIDFENKIKKLINGENILDNPSHGELDKYFSQIKIY